MLEKEKKKLFTDVGILIDLVGDLKIELESKKSKLVAMIIEQDALKARLTSGNEEIKCVLVTINDKPDYADILNRHITRQMASYEKG